MDTSCRHNTSAPYRTVQLPTSSGNDEVEEHQHPGQVHGLELCAEPEADDGVPVVLAPDVQHRDHHRVHQHLPKGVVINCSADGH